MHRGGGGDAWVKGLTQFFYPCFHSTSTPAMHNNTVVSTCSHHRRIGTDPPVSTSILGRSRTCGSGSPRLASAVGQHPEVCRHRCSLRREVYLERCGHFYLYSEIELQGMQDPADAGEAGLLGVAI